MDQPHALTLVVLIGCAEPLTTEVDALPGLRATGIVSAPGDTGSGFGDARNAVNGVLGGGRFAGSTDVFSLHAGDELVLSFDEPVPDDEGPDLAVFENPFDVQGGTGRFMDPAVVEVSDDCEQFVAFPVTGPATWSSDPTAWSGFAGLEPVLLHEQDNRVDPLGDEAGGDRFDLAEVGLSEVLCVRITPAADHGFPADPISDGPDVDGVWGRLTAP